MMSKGKENSNSKKQTMNSAHINRKNVTKYEGSNIISTTNGFEVSLIAMKSNTNKSNWYFDLGAIHYVTINKGNIRQFTKVGNKVKVKVVGGEDHIVKGNDLVYYICNMGK